MSTQKLLPGELWSDKFSFFMPSFSKKYDVVLWNFVYSVSTHLCIQVHFLLLRKYLHGSASFPSLVAYIQGFVQHHINFASIEYEFGL